MLVMVAALLSHPDTVRDPRYRLPGVWNRAGRRTPAWSGRGVSCRPGQALRRRIPDRGGWTAFGQPEGTRPAAREMTVSSVGQLWTARTDQYVLERWNPDGSVGVVVSRPVPWFPGPPGPVDLASKPAPPAMAGLLADSAANLWVFIAETRQPFEPPVVTRSDGRREIDLDLWLSRRDTRIEVIDSRRGTVLAEGKHRGLIWPTGTFPLVYSVRDPLNDPVVVVRRLVLATGGDRR